MAPYFGIVLLVKTTVQMLVKEVFDVFHQRPSIMKDSATMEEEQLAAQEAAMAPAPPNVAPDMGLPQPSIPVALPPLVR